MQRQTTRREFLGHVSNSAAVLGAASALGGWHVSGAEKQDIVRLGIIGCGGIMTHHVNGIVSRGDDVSIAWLCDVDPGQIDNSRHPLADGEVLADLHLHRLQHTVHGADDPASLHV